MVGSEDMWQSVGACGRVWGRVAGVGVCGRVSGLWHGWGHAAGVGDMRQGVGACGRVWGHVAGMVAGCGEMWQGWGM